MKKVEYFVDGDPTILETGVGATIIEKSVVDNNGYSINVLTPEVGYKRRPLNLKEAEGWLVDLDGVFMVKESYLTKEAFIKYSKEYKEKINNKIDLLKLNIGKVIITTIKNNIPIDEYLSNNRKSIPKNLLIEDLIEFRKNEINEALNNLSFYYDTITIKELTQEEKIELYK